MLRRPPGAVIDEAELIRRGSHATTYGQNFSWVLAWTILGGLLPGTGLIAAGRRRLGLAVLAVIGVTLLLAVGFLLTGNPLQQGLAFASNPNMLLGLAIAAGVIGLVWVGIILFTTSELRRYAVLTSGQRTFTGLVVLALAVGVALPAYKVGDYALITREVITSKSIFGGDGGPNGTAADPWADKPRVNMLVIGSDAGSTRGGVRPDTLIVASVDTKSGNTVLLSLPRSLQKAPFAPGTPGAEAWPNGYNCGNECLINAVWTWAEGDGQEYYAESENPGLQATQDVVQGVLDLEIDTYVMLNLEGFEDFVDAIGKVTVNVKERLPIGGSTENPVATGGYIEIGDNQELDGFHALWFARSRWSTDDYSRMQRQRCLIDAIVKKADPTTLALNLGEIAKALEKNLATGISTAQLDAYLQLAQRVKDAKITSLTFTNEVVNTVNPDIPEVHQLVEKALADSVKVKPKKPAASAEPGGGTESGGGTEPDEAAAPEPEQSEEPAAKETTPNDAQETTAVC